MFISRLLSELHISLPDRTITIHCDNKQTIRLLTEEVARLKTKLRHVDIHNHWLRQEVGRKTIRVEYIKSARMTADGFTKVLPAGRWKDFLGQLGLEELKDRPGLKELDMEALQQDLDDLTLGSDPA